MSGSVTVNYLRQESEDETFTSMEQRLRLNYATALSNVDLLDLYFQFSRDEQTNPDAEELRPLAGLNLRGPEYRWLLEYREFEDRDREPGGVTRTTDTLFTTFTYEPDPEYPRVTLDYSRTESEDDAEPSQTDFVETDWGVRASYDRGQLSLNYSHRENTFDNNLFAVVPTNFQRVTGVAVDLAGIIYITDSSQNRVFRFSPAGAFLGEFGGFGTGEGQFINPRGIAVTSSFIYVVDSGNNRVQRFDLTGTFVSEFGTFGTGPAQFDNPYGIAVDSTGVYVTDQGNDRVQKFTADGIFLFAFGTTGNGPGNFSSPSGVISDGSLVFVADTQNHRIQVFDTNGTFIREWGSFGPAPGQFSSPSDVALDSINRVYVTDTGNNRVQVFTTTGVFLNAFGSAGAGAGEFNAPEGIAVTPANTVVVADTGNARFQVLSNDGVFLFQVGAISATQRFRSTEQVSDSFNLIYSRELFTGILASIDYDLFTSDEEDKDTGEDLTSVENHEINAQLRFQPYRWVTLSSLYSFEMFTTETGGFETDRDEFAQTYTASLQPIPKVTFTGTYSRDELDTNVGPDEDSTFTTIGVNLLPTDRVAVDLTYSNQQNEQDGEKILETDTLTAISNMRIYQGIDFNLQLTTSQTTDFEADGEVESQRARGRLRLVPRPNVTISSTTEYTTSDSQFVGASDVSTETVLSSLDLSWSISRRLDLFLDADYIKTRSAGETTDNVGYLSNLIWRMNDKLTFFLGYRGGIEEEEIGSFRVQSKFPFYWDTRMSVNYEIERGNEDTDRKFLFVELTKIF
ncbi:MAG: hypothetical protein Kow0099_19000 [Candidatus Abyssubacteria bacterium]